MNYTHRSRYLLISTHISGILQYDSEVYANGSNETCGNDGYGKDGNSSSGSGRYQIPHQIASHGMNTNRSPQHSDRNGIHDSSQNYSTVSLKLISTLFLNLFTCCDSISIYFFHEMKNSSFTSRIMIKTLI